MLQTISINNRRYLGNKFKLLEFIKRTIDCNCDNVNVFADLFAGTGCVGGYFKSQGYSIIANDIQYYSYVITKHMIENNGNLDKERMSKLIKKLNSLNGVEGFIYKNYIMKETRFDVVPCLFCYM